ncbi:hypothetical protein QWJ90_08430 [Microbacterium oryzae]|uniref:hypothetical protein n=1 Tax=Microbacterium oryzae TaxID=743009 RepID=UPI0025B0AD24|nr:hypothetical protein [Microbacterium oryzae]MDN3310955.1 hypothetical protein [Microbacterium oryzae]
MPWRAIELRLDRDSVAMGDDMTSHARVTTVARGTPLSTAIERNSPEIRSRGWSWVIVVDGAVTAVWSVDEGVRLLVADRALWRGPVEIHFRYFLQLDPAWLSDRLSRGATVVQVASEPGARVARFVFGRSIAELRALLEV